MQAGEELPCAGLVLEGGFSKNRLSQETIRTRLGVEPPALPAVRIFSVLDAEFLKHALWYAGPMLLLGVATLVFGCGGTGRRGRSARPARRRSGEGPEPSRHDAPPSAQTS